MSAAFNVSVRFGRTVRVKLGFDAQRCLASFDFGAVLRKTY